MHTRSAPVRHSHPPEGGIPSDLHVLGLPPAFILSQDQTLRCNIVFASCFSVSRVRLLFVDGGALQRRRSLPAPHPFSDGPAPPPGWQPPCCAGLRLSKNFRKPTPSLMPLYRRLRVQKYYILSYPQPFFQTFFNHIPYLID